MSIFHPLFGEDKQTWQSWVLVAGGSILLCTILVLGAGRLLAVPQIVLRDAATGEEIAEPPPALVIQALRPIGAAKAVRASILLTKGSRGYVLLDAAAGEVADIYVWHPAYRPAIREDAGRGVEVALERGPPSPETEA